MLDSFKRELIGFKAPAGAALERGAAVAVPHVDLRAAPDVPLRTVSAPFVIPRSWSVRIT